jgi:2'-5' RNA ligase
MTVANPGATVRLFLGLWPAPRVRAAIEAQADAWQWPAGARRTAPAKLHVTLHFLGSVAAAQVPALQQHLAVPWHGCELVLDRGEVWPGGIAVLEAGTVPQPLALLHAALREKLVEQAVPVEDRRYRPHVTLARKAHGARPPPDAAPLRWHAGPGYLLVQSVPGVGYVPLQRFG